MRFCPPLLSGALNIALEHTIDFGGANLQEELVLYTAQLG